MIDINALKSKKDYQELLFSLLEPLSCHYSKGGARVKLSGGGATYLQPVIELEAFARPLWGLVPFWRGGGRNKEFENIYIKGFTNGSDPNSPEYWGDCIDFDQRFVEMTPIALGLITVPEILWEPLSKDAKDNLSSWLMQINEHEISRCNWYFFRIIVNSALKALGCDYSQRRLDEDLSFIESCYKGSGWYEDGVSRRIDYYSSFAMQFYYILYEIFCSPKSLFIKERADMFFKDFILWFSSSGAPLAYGRSLTYRFATCAFFSAYSAICENKDIGLIKGIINRDIRYFLSKDILTTDGILTVGYGYPNLSMAEKYNAPGSPYWALKAFFVLALPDEHEFWNSEEILLDIEDGVYKLDKANMLIERSCGNVSAYVPGMLGMKSLGHFTEKYDKFVYSTDFPFSISHGNESIEESSADDMLSFEIDGYIFVRRGSFEYRIEDDSIYSKWEVPNIKIETEIIPIRGGHIRRHIIDSQIRCKAYDAGYSIEYSSAFSYQQSSYEIVLNNNGYLSSVENKDKNGIVSFIKSDPNTNLLYRNSTFPVVCYEIKKGKTYIENIFKAEKRGENE